MSRAGLALICFLSGILVDQFFSGIFFNSVEKNRESIAAQKTLPQSIPLLLATSVGAPRNAPLMAILNQPKEVSSPSPELIPLEPEAPMELDPAAELATSAEFGESLQRSFYENGKIKQFHWSPSSELMSMISYRESGYPESRVVKTADGVMTSTIYDDQGNAREVWALGNDGKSRLISRGGRDGDLKRFENVDSNEADEENE